MNVVHTWSSSGQLKAFFSLILNSICIVLFALFSLAFASLDFKEKLNWINGRRNWCWHFVTMCWCCCFWWQFGPWHVFWDMHLRNTVEIHNSNEQLRNTVEIHSWIWVLSLFGGLVCGGKAGTSTNSSCRNASGDHYLDLMYPPQVNIIAPQRDIHISSSSEHHICSSQGHSYISSSGIQLKWFETFWNNLMRSPNGHGTDFIQYLHLLQSHLCPANLVSYLIIHLKKMSPHALLTWNLKVICTSKGSPHICLISTSSCPHMHLKLPYLLSSLNGCQKNFQPLSTWFDASCNQPISFHSYYGKPIFQSNVPPYRIFQSNERPPRIFQSNVRPPRIYFS